MGDGNAAALVIGNGSLASLCWRISTTTPASPLCGHDRKRLIGLAAAVAANRRRYQHDTLMVAAQFNSEGDSAGRTHADAGSESAPPITSASCRASDSQGARLPHPHHPWRPHAVQLRAALIENL